MNNSPLPRILYFGKQVYYKGLRHGFLAGVLTALVFFWLGLWFAG